MALCIERYMKKDEKYRVLDIGSRRVAQQRLSHAELLADYDCDYVGVDIREGSNVDVVMDKPYRLPVKSSSMDIVLSGQTFEHIPFFWASILEIARVMRPNGYLFLTAPSRGHRHSDIDCWRFYPDGLRAIASWSRLRVREAFTDFPPAIGGDFPNRHDFGAIDSDNYYWGDSVGVFQKPARYPLTIIPVRWAVRWWANRMPSVAPKPRKGSIPAGSRERDDVLALGESQGARQA